MTISRTTDPGWVWPTHDTDHDDLDVAVAGKAALVHTHATSTDLTTGNWPGFTGSFVFKAGGTTIAAANYTVDARYIQIDKLVHFQVELTMAAGFSYGAASGNLSISLPVTPANRAQIVDALSIRSSVGKGGIARLGATTDTAALYFEAGTASTTLYATWASGDKLAVGGTYQAL